MAVVGIDLVTTMSAVARVNEMGKADIILNKEEHPITPSVVLFEDENTKVVGEIAYNSAIAIPDKVAQWVKNSMGKNVEWEFFDEKYTPEMISAIILRKLKEDSEKALGEQITGAVITVPAIFGDAERNATKVAGEIAGLRVLGIYDEPQAAALAFALAQIGHIKPETVLVYDLGGGTFDITVLRIEIDKIEMLATVAADNLVVKIGIVALLIMLHMNLRRNMVLTLALIPLVYRISMTGQKEPKRH